MIGFLLLAGSALVLLVGAELFTEHARAAGGRLRVSVLAIGLVLAGAEPEELFTAGFAALRDRPAIGAGDAIGANITMLTLVLGLAALFRSLPFGRRVRGYALAASLAALAAAASVAGGVSRWEAGGLVALYAVVLAVIWWRERQPPLVGEAAEIAERPDSSERAPGSKAVVLALLGIAIMASGGWLAVAGAERVVARLGIDDAAVGLTFVGLATVSELFALVWAAARRGIDELAVAGVLGSAIYNATATLGVAGLIAPIPSRGLLVAAWSAAALPIGLIAASRGGQLARPAGMTLLVAYAVFLGVVLL